MIFRISVKKSLRFIRYQLAAVAAADVRAVSAVISKS